MKLKKILLVGSIFLLLLATFVVGFYFGREDRFLSIPVDFFGEHKEEIEEPVDFSFFGEVYYLLEKNFPGFKNIDNKTLVYGAIEGVLRALDDPHTTFFDPEKSNIFLEDVAGEFQGVGIEIGIREGALRVISPIKNTPAYHAGIRAGDVIVGIDGESTEDILLEEAVSKIRGPKGEAVILEIFRNEEFKEIEIIREVIEIPTIEWELLEDNIAHLKLYRFTENIESEFAKVSREILSSPAEKIILDLRNNPGGILGGSISIASKFIEAGDPVVIKTNLENREEDLAIYSRGVPVFLDMPVVILINEGSASASEIVAGALRDQRKTPIIGMTSFGKGTIQQIHELSDGSVIKITEKYFLTPEGTIIDKEGIEPDYEVEISEEDFEKEIDPQLNKAIDVIKKLKE